MAQMRRSTYLQADPGVVELFFGNLLDEARGLGVALAADPRVHDRRRRVVAAL